MMHINEADRLIQEGQFLLDVREEFEYEQGHLQESRLIPLQQLGDRLDELPKNRMIYIHCQSGKRSAQAVKVLRDKGFQATNLEAGFHAYAGTLTNKEFPLPIDLTR